MIRLDISEYCSDCCDFDPDVTKPERRLIHADDTANVINVQSDTIVRCKYAKRCESIKRYLERQSQQGKSL